MVFIVYRRPFDKKGYDILWGKLGDSLMSKSLLIEFKTFLYFLGWNTN